MRSRLSVILFLGVPGIVFSQEQLSYASQNVTLAANTTYIPPPGGCLATVRLAGGGGGGVGNSSGGGGANFRVVFWAQPSAPLLAVFFGLAAAELHARDTPRRHAAAIPRRT
jgi:hypothetical protein